jgi:hypothetical protein
LVLLASAFALSATLFPLHASPAATGRAQTVREWTKNSSLVKGVGGWEGGSRLWNWTGGSDAVAPPPNKVEWVGDGRIRFNAVDTTLDIYGACSTLRQDGIPLDMAEVGSLFYEVTISNYSVSPVLAGWDGIAVPAHFRLKGRTETQDDLYLEIYLYGEGLNHPLAWAFMDPFGDGNRAIKAVGFFPGISSDHYMVRAPALPQYCSVTRNQDGTTTFRIDVRSLAREAIAKYNSFPYFRGLGLADLEFWRAEIFAEAGYLGVPGGSGFLGKPHARFTLRGFRVTYTPAVGASGMWVTE